MVSLAKLTNLLLGLVNPVNDQPSVEQARQAIRAAVEDFSARKPFGRVATLSIVSGQSDYVLPDDFLRLVLLEQESAPGSGVIVSSTGLIPAGGQLQREQVNVAGNSLTIYPTPEYSTKRRLSYLARYVLDEQEVYTAMPENVSHIVLLKAQSLCLRLQATASAGSGFKYSIGDFSVDKSGQGKSVAEKATAFERQYHEAIEALIGFVGGRL